jgi:hypothetical protein
MARRLKLLGIVAALFLVVSGFLEWVYIESGNISVKGIDASGTNYGKPAYFHFAMAFLFVLFSFIQIIWAKRANLLVAALNVGWAVRNFLLIPSCEGGECPIKKTGLYLMLGCSIIMLVASLFPDMELPADKNAVKQ